MISWQGLLLQKPHWESSSQGSSNDGKQQSGGGHELFKSVQLFFFFFFWQYWDLNSGLLIWKAGVHKADTTP
jgi:hypothetical protein